MSESIQFWLFHFYVMNQLNRFTFNYSTDNYSADISAPHFFIYITIMIFINYGRL